MNSKNKLFHPLPHHVLILGCGRSGTSIFGELFQHLSAYTYYSEPTYADLKKYDYSSPIAIKVPRESPDFSPTIGLSFPLSDLIQTIPAPKTIFWQIRHPLDTICSLKVGIVNNWGHHPRPLDWQQWLDKSLVEQCAHHWNYLNTIGFEKVANLAEITSFELMIMDANIFAKNICAKLKIDENQEASNIQTWSNRVQNTNNQQFVEAETSKAYSTRDHKVRVGRWKENLTSAELDLVVPMVRATATRFGYQL